MNAAMGSLVAHMWLLLALAYFIGLGVGWWIWGRASRPVRARPPASDEEPLGSLESDAPKEGSRDRAARRYAEAQP